jgi:hypothetical protein
VNLVSLHPKKLKKGKEKPFTKSTQNYVTLSINYLRYNTAAQRQNMTP